MLIVGQGALARADGAAVQAKARVTQRGVAVRVSHGHAFGFERERFSGHF